MTDEREDRLRAARGVVADAAAHAPEVLAEACRTVFWLSGDADERSEAAALLRLCGAAEAPERPAEAARR